MLHGQTAGDINANLNSALAHTSTSQIQTDVSGQCQNMVHQEEYPQPRDPEQPLGTEVRREMTRS
jgi:hypothetical protein